MLFGDYRVEIVPDAEFRLDGGAMFGVVPRALWSRESPPDAENRVRLSANCLFVHAGGNTRLDEAGRAVPAFPNARYLVSREEFDHAESPHERDRASYLAENWRPLVESGQLELREATYEVVPGLRMETVAGHSRTMQCVRLRRGGRTLYGFADLVPMRAHVA